MGAASVRQMAERISDLVAERLRLPRKGLDTARYLISAERHVPKAVAAQLRILAEAMSLTDDAQAMRRVDYERLSEAYEGCLKHLQGLPKGIRRTRFLSEVARNLWVNLTVFAAIAVTVWLIFLR